MPKDNNKMGRWRFRIAPGVKVRKRNVGGREYRAGPPGHPRWYHTDDENLVEELRRVPVHPHSPGSARCFQVFEAEEARRVHEEEQARIEPQGPDGAVSAPSRRRRRRRSAVAAAE